MKLLFLGLIRFYQIALSPLVNWRGPVCKFYPTCSHYGYEAVKAHGAVKGGGLAAWRVLRCNPFGAGGYDPVPQKVDRKARNLAAAGESSPSGDAQTSDRDPVVGSPAGFDSTESDQSDLKSLRGA